MKIDAQSFDNLARTVFAPVYPVIARRIVETIGITQGTCLDIGCGGGYLGAALARLTDLFVHFFDQSEEMLKLAKRTITKNGWEGRADILQGDVSCIGLPDGSVDLVVSRGSVFFWEDCAKAFREIYRILAPGGMAYIGGGFGSATLREQITQEMERRDGGSEKFRNRVANNLSSLSRSRFEAALKQAGITTYFVVDNNNEGLWLIIMK